MLTAWIIVSIILGSIWLIAFVGGNIMILGDPDGVYNSASEKKHDYQIFAAVLTASLFFVFFHWIILLALIQIFLVYGLFSAAKILYLRPWRQDLTDSGKVR